MKKLWKIADGSGGSGDNSNCSDSGNNSDNSGSVSSDISSGSSDRGSSSGNMVIEAINGVINYSIIKKGFIAV